MIDLEQYRISVGCFYYKRPSSGAPRAKSYIVLYGILKIGIECTINMCVDEHATVTVW